ncbi:hypothetical protein HUX88_02025 [Duganella sp. BJB1802]|uniref:hypothetical protein n=1 Tax=Duganella sp. BJB1802 TaxID=2744575 RepID=UPI001593D6B9|nr:hypothetical protein [Duganella sp. BJB1802]MCU6496540.1 hypothetical protein [Rugamonas sp. A1-17]NVD69337.1 hypothetical protein [Duganella sp. BJB1802]
MDKDQKLVNDISALLRDAGYTGLNVHTDQNGTLLNATRERGGVVLRLAPDMQKVGRRTEGGAAEARAERLDVHQVPAMEGVDQQIRANPELAKAMGIPAEHLKYIM